MKLKNILPFLLIFATLSVSSQEISPTPKNHAIGIVPQYMIMSGLRLDLDFRLNKEKNSWMVVAPIFYLSENQSGLWGYDSLEGVGIELQHRLYLSSVSNVPKGVYMGYGPVFQYFSITDTRLFSETYEENGIEYTAVRYGPSTTNVYKFGLTATAGYQMILMKAVYLDMYAGAGIRLSFDNTGSGRLTRYYNDWYGDYGYSGTMLSFGVRIGMVY